MSSDYVDKENKTHDKSSLERDLPEEESKAKVPLVEKDLDNEQSIPVIETRTINVGRNVGENELRNREVSTVHDEVAMTDMFNREPSQNPNLRCLTAIPTQDLVMVNSDSPAITKEECTSGLASEMVMGNSKNETNRNVIDIQISEEANPLPKSESVAQVEGQERESKAEQENRSDNNIEKNHEVDIEKDTRKEKGQSHESVCNGKNQIDQVENEQHTKSKTVQAKEEGASRKKSTSESESSTSSEDSSSDSEDEAEIRRKKAQSVQSAQREKEGKNKNETEDHKEVKRKTEKKDAGKRDSQKKPQTKRPKRDPGRQRLQSDPSSSDSLLSDSDSDENYERFTKPLVVEKQSLPPKVGKRPEPPVPPPSRDIRKRHGETEAHKEKYRESDRKKLDKAAIRSRKGKSDSKEYESGDKKKNLSTKERKRYDSSSSSSRSPVKKKLKGKTSSESRKKSHRDISPGADKLTKSREDFHESELSSGDELRSRSARPPPSKWDNYESPMVIESQT